MKHLTVTLLVLWHVVAFHHTQDQPGSTTSVNAVNIRQRGANGDGATDDTSAIVAAFSDVCAAGGGTIYIPPGTYVIDPASKPIPICSNLVVNGPGTLKVKPDAGNYRYIFAPRPTAAAVNDMTFTGITVDQNTAANRAATIKIGDESTYQLVWQIYGGTNLHFEDMHLLVSGVNAIVANGPTVSGVYIARNHIVYQKRPEQPPFDNSSLYVDADHFHVTDNSFVSTTADAARTAIEIHTGSGSVVGNTVNQFEIGMNLVDLHSATVAGNNVRNAGYGISLWSMAAMDVVTLSGNTISVAQVARDIPSSWGIATMYYEGVNGDFSNLQISSNTLTFEQERSPRSITGSVNYGIGLQAFGNISNVLVLGNEIVRAPVRGISIGVSNAKYATSRVSVRENRIIDAGSNFSSEASNHSAAVSVQGNLSAVDVLRNRLDFLSAPFIGHFSYWSFESGFTFRNVVVADNYATAVNGSPTNGLTASVIQNHPSQ